MLKQTLNDFSLISPEQFTVNPFTSIGSDWMLVTAGGRDGWNTMTAAWGGVGFIWRTPAVFVFVRYSRYTYEFMEQNPYFTLSFFGPEWKKALDYCGSHSGRDVDKAEETGLTPLFLDGIEIASGSKTGDLELSGQETGGQEPSGQVINIPAAGFLQAERIIAAGKLYSGELSPDNFASMDIHALYPGKDYHRMYIGRVEAILERKGLRQGD
jgi:hypothetical protein